MTDKELKDLVFSLAIESKKTDEQMKKTDEQMKKTDEQMKKTDEQMKKTDEQMKALQKAQEETSAQMKKTDEALKRIGIMVGGIANNQGEIAEEFFFNSLKDKPLLNGIKYDFIDKNITRCKNNIEDEYDIVMVNGKDIALIEVKYKLHPKDIDRLLNKKYVNFKKLYPEYKDYSHHLGLASFKIDDDIKEEALNNDIIVLQRKGDVIESFVP